MSRFPWSSKDDRKDSDVSDSNPGVPSSEVARLGEWTTSRREIWCFYLYSIVSVALFLKISLPFSNIHQRPTMDSPDPGLPRLNSRISSILQAMT